MAADQAPTQFAHDHVGDEHARHAFLSLDTALQGHFQDARAPVPQLGALQPVTWELAQQVAFCPGLHHFTAAFLGITPMLRSDEHHLVTELIVATDGSGAGLEDGTQEAQSGQMGPHPALGFCSLGAVARR